MFLWGHNFSYIISFGNLYPQKFFLTVILELFFYDTKYKGMRVCYFNNDNNVYVYVIFLLELWEQLKVFFLLFYKLLPEFFSELYNKSWQNVYLQSQSETKSCIRLGEH